MNHKPTDNRHDLFYELEAFNPKYQTVYRTIREAAQAANELSLYYEWLQTADGQRYERTMHGVRDTVKANEIERLNREKLLVGLNRQLDGSKY